MKVIVKHLVKKHINRTIVKNNEPETVIESEKQITEEDNSKAKTKKNKEKMTEEQILAMEEVASNMSGVKRVKKDKGLIERAESSKIILTEDNRQILND